MYRTVFTDIWRQGWFEELSVDARYLFLYFWTNPETRPNGVISTSKRRVMFDTRLEEERLDAASAELEPHARCLWEHGAVWVAGFAETQGSGSKWQKAVEKADLATPPEVLDALGKPHESPGDTPSMGVERGMHTPSMGHPAQRRDTDTPSVPHPPDEKRDTDAPSIPHRQEGKRGIDTPSMGDPPGTGTGSGPGSASEIPSGAKAPSGHSVSSLRSETGGSRASPPLGTQSACFQDWVEKLKAATNGRDTIGVLGEFALAQYSRQPLNRLGRGPPGLQVICRQVGQLLKSTGIEPEHLLEIMWRAAAGPQREDYLTYVRGAVRKEERRGRLRKAGRDAEGEDGWAGWTVIGDDDGDQDV